MNAGWKNRLALGGLIMLVFVIGLCGWLAPEILKRVIASAIPGLFFGHMLSLGGEVRSVRNTVYAVFAFIALTGD